MITVKKNKEPEIENYKLKLGCGSLVEYIFIILEVVLSIPNTKNTGKSNVLTELSFF